MTATRTQDAPAIAVRAFAHPLSITAVFVLIANDFVFKQMWPGVFTGKLSDFAGLLFFPLLVAIPLGYVVRSRRGTILLSVGVTATWFAAIKTVPVAARLTESLVASVVGHSSIVVDPTDLVAVVSLIVAYVIYERASAHESLHRRPHRIVEGPRRRRTAMTAVVILGTLAAVATSYSAEDMGYTDLVVRNDVVYAGRDSGRPNAPGYPHASQDDGSTWVRLGAGDTLDPSTFVLSRDLGPLCMPDQPEVCFSIDGTAVVYESSDGGTTWHVAWSLPRGRDGFVARYGTTWDPYDVRSWDMVIVGEPESTVLVAMGDDGILRRSPDGTWTRDVLGTAKPLAEPWANILSETVSILTIMMLALAGAALWARQLLDVRERISTIVGIGLGVVAVTAVVIGRTLGADDTSAFVYVMVVGPIGAWIGLAAVAALWARSLEEDRHKGRRILAISTVWILVAGLAAMAPFVAWSAGWIAQWTDALLASVSLAIVSLLVGIRSMRATAAADFAQAVEASPTAARVDDAGDDHQSRWRSSPGLRRWLAAILLAISAPVLTFGIFYFTALVPAYLAARWTGHRRPLSRAMVALGVGAASLLATVAVPLAYPSTILTWTPGVIVYSMVQRAPNRAAVWLRIVVVAVVAGLAIAFGDSMESLLVAMPLLFAAVDSVAVARFDDESETDLTNPDDVTVPSPETQG